MLSLLKSGMVMYLHAAPPCGTASKAREKKISSRLKKKGVPEPRPLRSTACPEGLPSLTGSEKTRVQKANDIYKRIAMLAEAAIQMNIVVSVENPTRSYLWSTKFFKHLIDSEYLHEVTFQQCMWGSSRNKWSTWYVSPLLFVTDHMNMKDGPFVKSMAGGILLPLTKPNILKNFAIKYQISSYKWQSMQVDNSCKLHQNNPRQKTCN